jgi:hypothetical protein
MFTVRTISVDGRRSETATYDDEAASGPETDQASATLAEFLASRPSEFREKLPFLQQEVELEWTAGPEGVALASIHGPSAAYSMGILLAGADRDADRMMLEAWKANVLVPIFGDEAGGFVVAPERPLFINLLFPSSQELGAALQLTSAALAAAYFRGLSRAAA